MYVAKTCIKMIIANKNSDVYFYICTESIKLDRILENEGVGNGGGCSFFH